MSVCTHMHTRRASPRLTAAHSTIHRTRDRRESISLVLSKTVLRVYTDDELGILFSLVIRLLQIEIDRFRYFLDNSNWHESKTCELDLY